MKRRSIAVLMLFALLLSCAALAVEVETMNVTPTSEDVTGNRAPVAENLALSTYRGVTVGGDFRAVDPDGDLLTFRLAAEPFKGSVTVEGGTFLYTPAEGRRGRDSFTYVAEDASGAVSAEATVTVQIQKQATKLSYADLHGSALEYAAVRLAEAGIFEGECVGGRSCFSPDSSLTRGEFLAMCASLTGMQPLEDVTRTGFSDDAGILGWQKPYVSAALLYGVVRGSTTDAGDVVFRSGDSITRAEAAVMLNNFLSITDAAYASADAEVPEWAAQAVSNLDACDICPASDFRAEQALTRGEAASLFSGALDVLAARGEETAFRWKN